MNIISVADELDGLSIWWRRAHRSRRVLVAAASSVGVKGASVVSSREDWMYKPVPRNAERSKRAMAKVRGRVVSEVSEVSVIGKVVKILAVGDWCCH